MDTFFEQIITIPKNKKILAFQIIMWVAALAASATLIVSFTILGFAIVGFAASFGILSLCYRWNCSFYCEFEYIFTNGDLDIDKIIAMKKRERKITLSVENTEELFKYDPEVIEKKKFDKKIIACAPDENSVCLLARHKKEGLCLLIFAPEEKMIKKIKEFIPRNILRASEI